MSRLYPVKSRVAGTWVSTKINFMQKRSAATIYYIRDAVWAFNSGLIFNALWVLYIDGMGLSLTQLSLMSIVITITVVLAEVPTGILADVYSRRLSVIMGGVLIGTCYILIGLFPLFWVSLLAAFIEAMGDSFVSGALQAWITDEVGADKVGAVFLRSAQISPVAHWVGLGVGIVLAALFDLRVPVLIGGLVWFVLSAFLVLAMPERGFVRPVETRNFASARAASARAASARAASLRSHFREAVRTFSVGVGLVHGSPTLLMLFAVQVLLAVFFDSFYRLSRAHFLRSLALPKIVVPLLGLLKANVWFGGFEALQGVLGLVGAGAVRRFVDLAKTRTLPKVLLGFYLLVFLGVLVFALTGHIVIAIVAWLMANVLHQLAEPIISTWLNQNIPSDVRATVLSMSSQASMLGVLGGNPAISEVGDRFGLRPGLLLTGVLLLPVLGLFGHAVSNPIAAQHKLEEGAS